MKSEESGMRQADMLIVNGTIVTQNENRDIIRDGAIAVSEGRIVDIGKASDVRGRVNAERIIDASGEFIFPGLINTHTHLFQVFMKGLGEGLPLYEWLESVTAPSTTAMTRRDGRLAGLVGLLDGIRSGTTTVLDFLYALPNTDLYDEICGSFNSVGMRGILGWGFLDAGEEFGLPRALFRPIEEGLRDFSEFKKKQENERINFVLAPGITFGCSQCGLELLSEFASSQNILITTHVNETPDDDNASMSVYGRRNIPFLEEIGFLGPDVLAVHCVNMTDEDIEILARNDVNVSHNPISNMYLGAGVAPVVEMRKRGITVSLAVDGAASNNSQDMLEILKQTGLMHKGFYKDPSIIDAGEVLDMATIGGAKAIGREEDLGSLELGKIADMFIYDPVHPRSVPVLNPVESLVFSSGQENIKTVLIGGNPVMENYVIKTVDENQILAESQVAADALSKRAGTMKLRRKQL